MESTRRFIRLRDLWGATVVDDHGRRIGTVEATVRRDDDQIDLLVVEASWRRRVHRVDLKDVEIDDLGRLSRRRPCLVIVAERALVQTGAGQPRPRLVTGAARTPKSE